MVLCDGNVPLQTPMLKSQLPVPQNVAETGNKSFKKVTAVNKRSCKWALILHSWCPCRRRRSGHR